MQSASENEKKKMDQSNNILYPLHNSVTDKTTQKKAN